MDMRSANYMRLLAISGNFVVLFMSPAAFASDGVINFSGEITAQTCTVSANGGATVVLPTVSTGTLATVGSTAGSTPFTIDLANCTPTTGTVRAFFETGVTVDMVTGWLANTASNGAANVQLQLLNADSSAIDVRQSVDSQGSLPSVITGGSAQLPFRVRYVAAGGAVTPGQVSSSVEFTLVYQ